MNYIITENNILYSQNVEEQIRDINDYIPRKSNLKEVGHIKLIPRNNILFHAPNSLLKQFKYTQGLLSFENNRLKSGSNKILRAHTSRETLIVPNNLPKEFDWRNVKDPLGNPILGPIRDQGLIFIKILIFFLSGSCGSCYAFCTATSLSHRFAIASRGEQRPILSPQDMVNCGNQFVRSTYNNPQYASTLKELYRNGTFDARAEWYAIEGCNGGLLVSSLDYLCIYGLPETKNVPYVENQQNENYCTERKKFPLYYGRKTHSLTAGWEDSLPDNDVILKPQVLKSNIENMKMAIISDGPIISAINIWTDFLYYPHIHKIYQKQPTILINGREENVKYEGGHAIVIIGWGEGLDENGNKIQYWICENSWGTDWGLDGYFFIEMGKNMNNVEYESYGIFPSLLGDPVASTPVPLPPNNNSVVSSNDSWWIYLVVFGSLIVISIVVSVTLSLVLQKRKKLPTNQPTVIAN